MNHNCKYKLHLVNTTEKILIQTSQTVNRVHHLFKEWCCKSLKIITLKMVHVILKKFEGLPQDSTSFKLVYIAVWLASSNKIKWKLPLDRIDTHGSNLVLYKPSYQANFFPFFFFFFFFFCIIFFTESFYWQINRYKAFTRTSLLGEPCSESVSPLVASNSGGTSMAASLYDSITGTVFICNNGMAGGRNGDEPREEAWDEARSESIWVKNKQTVIM